MAYKRYFIRNGKRFGPYYYESYRDEDGKVKKRYVGTVNPVTPQKKQGFSNKNFLKVFSVLFFLGVFVFAGFLIFNPTITGKALLEIQEGYIQGDVVSGNLVLGLRNGELIPENTKLIIRQDSESNVFFISDLINISKTNGSYYVEQNNLSDSGSGFGFLGTRETYPEVEFILILNESSTILENVSEENTESKNESIGNESGENGGGLEEPEEEIVIDEPVEEPIVDEPVENETLEEGIDEPLEDPIIEEPVEDVQEDETVSEGENNLEVPDESEETENNNPSENSLGDDKSRADKVEKPKKANEGKGEDKAEKVKEDNLKKSSELKSESSSSGQESKGNSDSQDSSDSGGESVQTLISGNVVFVGTKSNFWNKIVSFFSPKITGNVVLDLENEEFSFIEGKVSKENSFSYFINETEFYIEEGSVRSNHENLSVDVLDFELDSGELTITTDYSLGEEGFGEEFLTEKVNEVEISLEELGVLAEKGNLTIKLVYENSTLAEVSKEISVEDEIPEEIIETPLGGGFGNFVVEKNSELIVNLDNYFNSSDFFNVSSVENISLEILERNLIIAPEEDFVGSREANLSVFQGNNSFEYEFDVLVVDSLVSYYIELRQAKAVINRPVKWQKKITGNVSNLEVDLPSNANNVSVKTGDEAKRAEEEFEEYETLVDDVEKKGLVSGSLITGNVALDLRKEKSFVESFVDWLGSFSLTGQVVSDFELNESNESKKIIIDVENETIIEYYTSAPVSVEEEILEGKRVTVSADSELGYRNVLAYTTLESLRVPIGEKQSLKLFWYENGSLPKKSVEFEVFDLTKDGFIDFVEWNVPHLSEQVYELVIVIVGAEHLDSNKTFVKDVYDYVGEKDDVWFDVPSGDYLRVTFEKNLTDVNDITLYAGSVCNESVSINGTEVPCEIYFKKMELDRLRRENG